ncbi:MAG: hypothetical protein M3389_04170 [Actinomycetota bacterium]|nr:hypothetical protein [Actinomycetota bacterium]
MRRSLTMPFGVSSSSFRLVTNRRYGIDCKMLVEALGRTDHREAVGILTSLLDDPDVSRSCHHGAAA